jgi:hypothetical protein
MYTQLSLLTDDLPQVAKAHKSKQIGNTMLVYHGIEQDNSEWRVHVSYANVYIFLTQVMKERCEQKSYRVASAYQPVAGKKIETAKGFLVPIKDVSDLRVVAIPDHLKSLYKWPPASDVGLGDQGKRAESLVQAMMQCQLIIFPRNTVVETSAASQFGGVDLVHKADEVVYQVKSDLGIEKYWKNIYIQTYECNPNREY